MTLKNHPTQDHSEPTMPLGGSALRSDSLGKVTGKTQYVEDMKVPGTAAYQGATKSLSSCTFTRS